MTSTSSGFVHYTDEDIVRLKWEEAQRWEKTQRHGTIIKQEYSYKPQPNRKERRRIKAQQRSER